MAGSPSGALLLLALGYRNLSVSPAKAPVLRYLSSKVGISMLENLRHNLINQNKESEIERCIYDTLEKIDPILLEIE